jgi:carbamoyltransferase
MIILGVSRGRHDASATLLVDGNIVFHLESERLSNLRHDRYAFQVIQEIKKYVSYVDYVVLTGTEKNPKYAYEKNSLDVYSSYVLGLGKSFYEHGIIEVDLSDMHHEIHASTAFYNSGFKKALCIVKDGQGSVYSLKQNAFLGQSFGYETGSVFIKKYPNETVLVEKHVSVNFDIPERKLWVDDNVYVTNCLSEAIVFEKASEIVGLSMWDAGKTMGLSSYGKKNSLNLDVYKDDLINEEIFNRSHKDIVSNIKKYIPVLETFQDKANFASKIQNEIQEHVAKEIIKHIEQTNEKNVCLSGGFFLNCVSNYNLLKFLPKDVNIYIEPMSTDGGNSLGAAKFLYHHLTKSKKIQKQKTLYYGPQYDYKIKDLKNHKIIKNVTKEYVANLLANKKIIALYQGKSEAGHRALGNRSILYDPRDVNGKDYVNTVKKREFFRPFAGTIMEEFSSNWFDMKQLKDSKFMMYAVDVLENKKELIPAITHIDGTCRVQTVSKKDNKHFYELINEFYKITNVPILLNTSFNLAGNAIVETLEDALNTVYNSNIDYLYLPELKILVTK